jgi:hypothetical protein
VSTDDQTLNLQRDALKKAKCRQIYEEHARGGKGIYFKEPDGHGWEILTVSYARSSM